MKKRTLILIVLMLMLCMTAACGNKERSFTAEDFVSGKGEDSTYDDKSYCEVLYYGDMAYATTESDGCDVAVELMVGYIYHNPETDSYTYMTSKVKAESKDFAKAVFEQENCCVLYAEAKHTITVGDETKNFETRAGELPK